MGASALEVCELSIQGEAGQSSRASVCIGARVGRCAARCAALRCAGTNVVTPRGNSGRNVDMLRINIRYCRLYRGEVA